MPEFLKRLVSRSSHHKTEEDSRPRPEEVSGPPSYTSNPPTRAASPSAHHEDAPPPPFTFPASYPVGQHGEDHTGNILFIARSDVQAHVRLLAAFDKLRLAVEAHTEGVTAGLDPASRWAVFVEIAIYRFELFLRAQSAMGADGDADHVLPPLDVAMVLHTYMTNPLYASSLPQNYPGTLRLTTILLQPLQRGQAAYLAGLGATLAEPLARRGAFCPLHVSGLVAYDRSFRLSLSTVHRSSSSSVPRARAPGPASPIALSIRWKTYPKRGDERRLILPVSPPLTSVSAFRVNAAVEAEAHRFSFSLARRRRYRIRAARLPSRDGGSRLHPCEPWDRQARVRCHPLQARSAHDIGVSLHLMIWGSAREADRFSATLRNTVITPWYLPKEPVGSGGARWVATRLARAPVVQRAETGQDLAAAWKYDRNTVEDAFKTALGITKQHGCA